MKKLIIGLLVLGSISTFAQSEFERGYGQGLNSCSKHNAYSCEIDVDFVEDSKPHVINLKTVEPTRGEAISKIAEICSDPLKYNKIFIKACIDQIRKGKTICLEL